VANLKQPSLDALWRLIGPPLGGAFFLMGWIALRVLLFAGEGGRAAPGEDVETVFAFAGVSGAACGLVYSLIGRPLRRRGAVGNYLAGIVTVAPYFAFLLFVLPDPQINASPTEPFWLVAWAIVSSVVGVFLGREFHEKDNLFKPNRDNSAT
jgi:hypothetical protein